MTKFSPKSGDNEHPSSYKY